MNRDELLARMRDPEDAFVERKSDGVKPFEIRRTVVAFANSVPQGREAVLFIGVNDKGDVVGCRNPDTKQRDLRQACESECYPPIIASYEVLNTKSGSVVACIIGPSSNRPHFAGPAYVRRGSESVAASAQMLDELVHSRNSLTANLLRLRHTILTVQSVRHMLGSTKPVAGNDYRQHAECIVLECDAHFVRLQNISTKEYYSEPLENIRISRDEHQQRPMLIVREPML